MKCLIIAVVCFTPKVAPKIILAVYIACATCEGPKDSRQYIQPFSSRILYVGTLKKPFIWTYILPALLAKALTRTAGNIYRLPIVMCGLVYVRYTVFWSKSAL